MSVNFCCWAFIDLARIQHFHFHLKILHNSLLCCVMGMVWTFLPFLHVLDSKKGINWEVFQYLTERLMIYLRFVGFISFLHFMVSMGWPAGVLVGFHMSHVLSGFSTLFVQLLKARGKYLVKIGSKKYYRWYSWTNIKYVKNIKKKSSGFWTHKIWL